MLFIVECFPAYMCDVSVSLGAARGGAAVETT